MKARLPIRASTADPKTNSMSMLPSRWRSPPCTNMYVMKVHGRASAWAGSKASRLTRAGEVNNVKDRSRITALAMISRPTQGVTRGYGGEFIVLAPSNSYLRLPLRWAARPGDSADPIAQLGNLDAHGPGRLGQKAGCGHAGQRIHL